MCERKSISPSAISVLPCLRVPPPCRAFRHGGIVRGLPGESHQRPASCDRNTIHTSYVLWQGRASEWGASVTPDSQLGAEPRTNRRELWRAALVELQLAMPKANYDTWFKETYVVSEEDDVFCIGVPNAFAREWLENKYRTHVRASLQRPWVRY